MKKIITVIVVFSLIATLTGCDSARKKFVRKKKEPVKMPRIYQVQRYEKRPSAELYRKHYTYWASWQTELVKVIGQNHRRDIRCIAEIVTQLQDMRNLLVEEKAKELDRHIEAMKLVKTILTKDELSTQGSSTMKETLLREERLIKKGFAYNKVKESIKESPEKDAQSK